VDSESRNRVNLALKILSYRHRTQTATTPTQEEIENLKACYDGDPAGKDIFDIAARVIHAELERQQAEFNHRPKSA